MSTERRNRGTVVPAVSVDRRPACWIKQAKHLLRVVCESQRAGRPLSITGGTPVVPRALLAAGAVLGTAFLLHAAPGDQAGRGKGGGKGAGNKAVQDSACLQVPARPLDLVLGRPTRDSVSLSVLTFSDTEGRVAYGTDPSKLDSLTPARAFKKGEPAEIVIGGLKPDTRYFYQFRARGIEATGGSFHTARPPGAAFTFTITADSHLDDRASAAVYQQTLANALADKPDFHIDLGDTFMTEKHVNRDNATRQYLAQRYYFGRLCHSAPLFLVLGNHDGESPRGQGSAADDLAVWSNTMRKRFFPNPVPGAFYTGNATPHPQAGLLQDYHAWQWGDALFVALDPFWFTQKQRGQGDNWQHTLGEAQYRWLKRTLEGSKARYRFVFIHHLVGGIDAQCRGGAEAAPLYEWGGRNADGSDGFAAHRPGWAAPIHQLLVRHKVNAVFHGHDHLYAKKEIDGIVYQEVPQPGAIGGNRAPRHAAEYGYRTGVILGGAGHLRVAIRPAKATLEYVASVLPAEETAARKNGSVADSYVIKPGD